MKEHLGDLPLSTLEEPDDINRFKTESDYAEDVELATPHHTLETLRAAINWGLAETPPLLTKSPFHRFGVREEGRDEPPSAAVARDEEKRLLDTALTKMNAPEHQFVGPVLHDRIVAALEHCCRRGKLLMIQHKRVNRDSCQVGIPGASGERQREPSDPVQSEGTAGRDSQATNGARPEAYVFGSAT